MEHNLRALDVGAGAVENYEYHLYYLIVECLFHEQVGLLWDQGDTRVFQLTTDHDVRAVFNFGLTVGGVPFTSRLTDLVRGLCAQQQGPDAK